MVYPFFIRTLVKGVFVCVVVSSVFFTSHEVLSQSDENVSSKEAAIREKEQELERLAKELEVLRQKRSEKEQEGESVSRAIELAESRIRETQLELDRTAVSIEDVQMRITINREHITSLEQQIAQLHGQLRVVLRAMDMHDARSLFEVLFGSGTFADFMAEQSAYISLQNRVVGLLHETEAAIEQRKSHETQLAEQEDGLQQLHRMQAVQRESLRQEERQQREILAENIQEQAQVTARMAEVEQAREDIARQVFTMRSAGVEISLARARELAQFAGGLTGVRPALILGVLKVESNLGTNIGSGRYPDDVHPGHREAFLRVTEKLGLNPLEAPVSAKPKTYQGWGGAMGPGQIMPLSWERLESTVARLTGKSLPSPYDLSDAIVGTAVMLQGLGAADGREYEAVNRYFAGGNWQRFTWYGDRVLAVAAEYEREGI